MKEKIKVAIIAADLGLNGISSVIMNYCRNINENEIKFSIFAGAPIAESYKSECIKRNIDLIELPDKRKFSKKYYKQLYKKIKKNEFDIAHVHGNSAAITVELLITKLKGIKNRIAHCHNSTCNNIKMHKLLSPFFNCLITERFACSKKAGKWMFNKKPFIIIPNGFQVEKFKYNEDVRLKIRNEYNLNDRFVIGHVGRFNTQKNHEFLLKLFTLIVEKKSNSTLFLIGTGPDYEKIQELIKNHPYKNQIVCYGETDNIAEMYNAFDIFVFPSKYEGLGIVLLEAQINGLKCVTSDVVPNEVSLGDNIKFISLDNKCNEWVNEILLSNDIDRKMVYEKQKEKIKKYDITVNANNLVEQYKKIAKKD